MPQQGSVRTHRRITASHLYDYAVCEHRVALDFTLDRSQRTPPDDALAMLTAHGRDVEEKIARELGYEFVAFDPSDPSDVEPAFRRTLELMRQGVPGIYQGVLHLDETGDRPELLAIPDLLRRADGRSDFGDHHYIPGDIKSGLEARTDQVLQVVFSARLLERIQGRRPATGYLIMADGEETSFDTADVWDSAELAYLGLVDIATGARESFPAFCPSCERCRWRGSCIPALEEGPDLSFVAGMTRTRKRLLVPHEIVVVEDLATLDRKRVRALESKGVPTEGLLKLQKQAKSLLTRETIGRGRRRKPLAGAGLREHFVLSERDPLGGGEPFLIAHASRPARGRPMDQEEVLVADDDASRSLMLDALVRVAGDGDQPLFHYGRTARRAFDRLADRAAMDPARQGRIAGRFIDLAPIVRGGAYLPVRRYRFDEVAALLTGRPSPVIGEPEDAPFVWFENWRQRVSAPRVAAPNEENAPASDGSHWKRRLEQRARRDLEGLIAVRDWVAENVEDDG